MKKKSLKVIVSALVIGVMGLGFVGCGASNSGGSESSTISVSGSTSVGPLMEKLAEKYEENNDVTIEINQTGSSAGIKDATNGVSEIGMSSRDLKDEEKGSLDETIIAYDGIAVITNTANKIQGLTMDQLKDIYTGKITNWKELGGNDAPIVVVSREEGSGTRTTFEEMVGYKSEELLKDAQIADGSGNIKSIVKGNENSIGFVSFEYLDDSINAVKVNDVAPTPADVINGTYPISRGFLLVTKSDVLTDSGKKFMDWILTDEGQQIVEESGVIKVK